MVDGLVDANSWYININSKNSIVQLLTDVKRQKHSRAEGHSKAVYCCALQIPQCFAKPSNIKEALTNTCAKFIML